MTTGRSKPLFTEYDDLLRRYKVLFDEPEQQFLQFIEVTSTYCKKFSGVDDEVSRLQRELTESKTEIENLQVKLKSARQFLNIEKCKRIAIEKDKMELEKQIYMVKNMLNKGNINETMERLQVLSSTINEHGHGYEKGRISLQEVLSPGNLSTINEDADTIGSIINISDMDLTDADELEDMSRTRSGRSFRLSSNNNPNKSENKRKSSPSKLNRSKSRKISYDEDKENVGRNVDKANLEKAGENHSKIEYTPSAPPLSSSENIENEHISRPMKGTPYSSSLKLPCTPQSQTPVISYQNTPRTPVGSATYYQSPGSSPMLRHGSISKANGRQHCFAPKVIYWTDFCQPCEKRIMFGKPALKCRDCRTTCHLECQDSVPLPCVPTVTPGNKSCAGSIADFTPRIPPMVPAIIVHCTNEVESRGLTEVGIYRVPGSEREVKELRDRFIKGKGIPNLAHIDIYVICSAVKAFLRALKEPVIPCSQWRDFVTAVGKTDIQDSFAHLYQVVSDMPQPNRDTLAWIILHLQRVAEYVECKMPVSNLAKVFGPTLLGYSVPDPNPQIIVEETKSQQQVIELLLEISSDYWRTFIIVPEDSDAIRFASPEKQPMSTRRRSILSFTPLPQRDGTPKRGSRK